MHFASGLYLHLRATAVLLIPQIIGFIIAIGSVLYAAWDTVSQDKAFLPNDVERLQEADTRDVLKHSPVRTSQNLPSANVQLKLLAVLCIMQCC